MGRNADAFDFLLGEFALLDEIRHLDVAGHVNFRGASFRTYIPDSDTWYVLWMMANVKGYSELRAEIFDRSYDGGKTWIRPFVSYQAARRAAHK